jgi:hypothetical protein
MAPAVIVTLDADHAERQLRAGELACPVCGGRLRPWGWAGTRPVRRLTRDLVWLRAATGRR